MPAFYDTRRLRSWLMLETDNPEKVASQIFEEVGDPREAASFWRDQYADVRIGDIVVIRADVVEIVEGEAQFHLVIPVDTSSRDNMNRVKDYLRNHGPNLIEANVVEHAPHPPYISNGFISDEESRIGEGPPYNTKAETTGITRKSPGDNPWG